VGELPTLILTVALFTLLAVFPAMAAKYVAVVETDVDAAFDSLAEGMKPHEVEAAYWGGYYETPELTQVPLEALSR